MQWDLLRTFEAVARQGSLTAAAKSLGVSQSTVSRHVRRLEEEAGTPLLMRDAPVQPTPRGEALLAALVPMVDGALAAQAALDSEPEPAGEVTLTTVGELLRWHIAERLPAFYRKHRRLRLRLLADNQLASLAAGEADIALRLVRPERGELVTRRLTIERYGLFAREGLALDPDTPWLGLAGTLAHVPEQRFAESVFSSRPPRLAAEDVDVLGLAVQAELGVAFLPHRLAARLNGLVEIEPSQVGGVDRGPVPERTVWLVVHEAKQRLPRVRAVIDWLVETV